jgi:hypothetical protein
MPWKIVLGELPPTRGFMSTNESLVLWENTFKGQLSAAVVRDCSGTSSVPLVKKNTLLGSTMGVKRSALLHSLE